MVPGRTLALLLFLAPSIGSAAEPEARLTGTVRDESGLALPGVTVEVDGLDARLSRSAATDPAGAYEVTGLSPGRYQVVFRLPSFATSVQPVSLADGAQSQVDAVLRVALTADVLVTSRRTFRNLTDLDQPVNGLLGLANAGSEGVVSSRLIEQRPVYRAGEIFEAVPGVVISQHSGEGKANQYYVRGFNIDHGTDLASFVAGVPVNMPSHGHGQGYSDNNFLIPELVAGVQYQKGTYSAEEGDFSAAGSINVNYLNLLDRPLAKLEGGPNGFGRALVAASSRVGDGQVLYAAEGYHSDGPWVNPDDYRKLNAVVRYSRGNQQDGLSLTGMAYAGRWNSTDQIPARAVGSGQLDRFGAVDTSDRGETHRLSLSGEWRRSTSRGLTQVKAYAIDYGLDLFSNFTYFLDDPVNGDQFEQKDQRSIFGASVSQRFLSRWFGRDTESVVGLQGRFDHIPTVGLYHTRERQRLETIRQDRVDQGSGSAFFQASTQWTSAFRTVAGVRGDLYGFDVRSNDPANSGQRTAGLLSPKLSVVLGPWSHTEVYANWGLGFHSNDARGAVQTRDPKTGEPVEPVDPIVRARGGELGIRTLAIRRYQSAVTLWGLDLDSELLFVGDAGTTEASRPSRRLGFEWSNVFTAKPWLTLDADLAYSRTRFRDQDPAGDRIPGAVEGVASAGVTVDDRGRFSGSLRLRYFGPRPLVEDNSVRSQASATLNARLSWRLSSRYLLAADVFNLTDAAVSDVDYYYASRLPGEPAGGVNDVHTHPLESRSFRLSLTAAF
jgi:carboxypeptidase family protein/TonB-dependent receptor-like protein